MKKFRKIKISFVVIILTIIFLTLPIYAFQDPGQTASNLEKRGLHPLLITGFISLLPIFELRGAIPVGIALLKQRILLVYIISVVFNLIPILPILYLLLPVRRFFVKRGIFSGFINFLDKKAKKNSKIVEKYGEFGLALFVAIPLPVTGAWTGSLIAVFMGLPPIKSFLFITLGVFSAGIIVTLITVIGMKALILVIPVIIALFLYLIISYFRIRSEKKEGING